jgi:hypothetical protein
MCYQHNTESAKHYLKTRYIPIHIVTVKDEREWSLRLGVVSLLQKPVTKQTLEDVLTRPYSVLRRTKLEHTFAGEPKLETSAGVDANQKSRLLATMELPPTGLNTR